MIRLIRDLVRPYRGQLAIILFAMLVETAMSLAGPWPLKIIIDNVVGNHKMSPWLDHLVRPMLDGGSKLLVAGLAALAFERTACRRRNGNPRMDTVTRADVTKFGQIRLGDGDHCWRSSAIQETPAPCCCGLIALWSLDWTPCSRDFPACNTPSRISSLTWGSCCSCSSPGLRSILLCSAGRAPGRSYSV